MLTLADQLKSIRRFIHGLFPALTIHIERDRNRFERPAFLVENIQTETRLIAPRTLEDYGSWQVSYFADSKAEAMAVTDSLRWALGTQKRIPVYLFNFKYPVPTVSETPGDIPPGTYEVQVSGIGHDGSESLPSDPVSVTLSGSGALTVTIPRLLDGLGPFASYAVYVNGKRHGVTQGAELGNTTYVVNSLPLADAAGPVEKSVILVRYMKIDDIFTLVQEDGDRDGKHIGILRFTSRVTVPMTREFPEVMKKVTVTGIRALKG